MNSTLFDLKAKKALITGASGGLGQGFARALHQAGAHVILSGRDGQGCSLLAMDLNSEASISESFAGAAADGSPINVLVNNAGMATSSLALKTAAESFDAVLSANLRGPWLLSQQFAQSLVDLMPPPNQHSCI